MDTNDIKNIKLLENKVHMYLNRNKFDYNKLYYVIPCFSFVILIITEPYFIKESMVVNSIKTEKISPKKFLYTWLFLTLILFGILIYYKKQVD
jgi:hypothetical protein